MPPGVGMNSRPSLFSDLELEVVSLELVLLVLLDLLPRVAAAMISSGEGIM